MDKKVIGYIVIAALLAASTLGLGLIPQLVESATTTFRHFDNTAANQQLFAYGYANLIRILALLTLFVVVAIIALFVLAITGTFSNKCTAFATIGLYALLFVFLFISFVAIPASIGDAANPSMTWDTTAAGLYNKFREGLLNMIAYMTLLGLFAIGPVFKKKSA